MTEIYLHIFARMADYIRTHPYTLQYGSTHYHDGAHISLSSPLFPPCASWHRHRRHRSRGGDGQPKQDDDTTDDSDTGVDAELVALCVMRADKTVGNSQSCMVGSGGGGGGAAGDDDYSRRCREAASAGKRRSRAVTHAATQLWWHGLGTHTCQCPLSEQVKM